MPALESLDELRVFIRVVDQRSFSAAARSLGRTTNVVSRRIAQLEERLGVRLLHRTTRSVSVTDEGLRFAEASRRILDDVELAESAVRHVDEAAGLVRLVVPTVFVGFGLVSALGQILARNAALRIELLVSDAPMDLVAAGVDVAIVDEHASEHNVVRMLGRIHPALAAAPSYIAMCGLPRQPADLAAHACLRFLGRKKQTYWPLVDREGRRVRATLGGRFESNDSRVLHEALYAGLGIGLCTEGELASATAVGRLTPVLPNHRVEPMAIRAVVPARPLPRRARRVELVLSALSEVLRAWDGQGASTSPKR